MDRLKHRSVFCIRAQNRPLWAGRLGFRKNPPEIRLVHQFAMVPFFFAHETCTNFNAIFFVLLCLISQELASHMCNLTVKYGYFGFAEDGAKFDPKRIRQQLHAMLPLANIDDIDIGRSFNQSPFTIEYRQKLKSTPTIPAAVNINSSADLSHPVVLLERFLPPNNDAAEATSTDNSIITLDSDTDEEPINDSVISASAGTRKRRAQSIFLEQFNDTFEEVDRQHDQLDAEVERQRVELKSRSDEIEALQLEVKTRNKEREGLQADIESKDDQIKSLQRESESWKSEAAKFEALYREVQVEHLNLKTTIVNDVKRRKLAIEQLVAMEKRIIRAKELLDVTD